MEIKMKSSIELSGMEFYAYHGVLAQEQSVGNRFVVDVMLDIDVTAATKSDELEDTLNYAEVYALIKREMATSSRLLEHVGGRIIDSLHREYPLIERILLKITKKTPPIMGILSGASVILEEKFG